MGAMFAQAVATLVAIFAGTFGAGALVLALFGALFWLAVFDMTDVRQWQNIAKLGAWGVALFGYAVAHVALYRRPRAVRAIGARAAFTLAVFTGIVLMLRSVLNTPPPEHTCGMYFFAELAPFMLAMIVVGVEVLAWLGWWFNGIKRISLNTTYTFDSHGCLHEQDESS